MSFKFAIRLVAAAFATLLVPAVAFAHPGIGAGMNMDFGLAHGFAHPFTGLDHVLAMVAVGVLAANLGDRAMWAIPLTFVALMALGGALGVAGVGLPFVEAIIALSVVVLGLMVAIPREWPLPAAMALVGAFAIFHGHAHGAEMTGTMSFAAYGLGFILATGLLHLLGIAMGLAAGRLGDTRAWVARIGGGAIAAAGAVLLAMG